MQEGAWYRLVVAIVIALVAFSNQFFGTHISTADAVSVVSIGIALIVAEAAVLHGKGGQANPGEWSDFFGKLASFLKEFTPPAPAPKTTTGIPPATATTTMDVPDTAVAPPAAAGTAADRNTGDKVAHDA